MKISLFDPSHTLHGLGLSHAGLQLKHSAGGPPWWKHINGFWFSNRKITVFVEFWKAYEHRKGIYHDRRRRNR